MIFSCSPTFSPDQQVERQRRLSWLSFSCQVCPGLHWTGRRSGRRRRGRGRRGGPPPAWAWRGWRGWPGGGGRRPGKDRRSLPGSAPDSAPAQVVWGKSRNILRGEKRTTNLVHALLDWPRQTCLAKLSCWRHWNLTVFCSLGLESFSSVNKNSRN